MMADNLEKSTPVNGNTPVTKAAEDTPATESATVKDEYILSRGYGSNIRSILLFLPSTIAES